MTEAAQEERAFGLNGLEEAALYELSDTLGVEIYVVGVGRSAFLPKQSVAPAFVRTREGGLAEWMREAIDRPDEQAWWAHTHPGIMGAFFSSIDEQGAHALWEAVRRPIVASVLGQEGQKHEVTIDGAWIEAHPYHPPMIWDDDGWVSQYFRGRGYWDDYPATGWWDPARQARRMEGEFTRVGPDGQERISAGLVKAMRKVIRKHGWIAVDRAYQQLLRQQQRDDLADLGLVPPEAPPAPGKVIPVSDGCGTASESRLNHVVRLEAEHDREVARQLAILNGYWCPKCDTLVQGIIPIIGADGFEDGRLCGGCGFLLSDALFRDE